MAVGEVNVVNFLQCYEKCMTVKNVFVHRLSLLKCSMLVLVIFTFAGCQTSKLNESSKKIVPDQPHSEIVTLQEGDDLKISFPGSATLDTTQQIRRDGKISLPLVGEVQAAGETPDDLQKNLINLYAPQISSKEVIVTVESSAFPVYVTGCVIRPGKISSDKPMTALEAVMEAGGFDYEKANLRNVRVIRSENGVSKSYTLNLKLALNGNEDKPFYLKPSDIIYVPEKFSWF
jgi:polysaccharide export outer membrane protein